MSKTFPPHIFAGVSSILHFISKSSGDDDSDFDEEMLEFLEPIMLCKDPVNDEDFKELVNALIVAIYFLVLARRRNPVDDQADAENESKKLDKKTFSEMRQTALVSLGLPANDRRHRDDVDQWIALIMEQGWTNGQEWFENVPQAGELFEEDDEHASGEDEGVTGEGGDGPASKRLKSGRRLLLPKEASRKGLLPGLGTMMQDRVDWLNPDRKEDFLEWKGDVVARIEQMERTGQVVG